MGTRIVARLLGALLLLVGACAPASPDASVAPRAATRFLTAHGTADASGVAASVSPLYWAELRRRGRDAEGLNPIWTESAPLLEFAYVGGIEDNEGFKHLLYSARPKTHSGGPTSVWRVDLDPGERVIWGEPTRLLSSEAQPATPGPRVDAARRLVRSMSSGEEQRDGGLVGVNSANGDGYYALGLYREGAARPTTVVYFGVDQDGARVPDFWSFGRDRPVGSGSSRLTPLFRLDSTGLAAEDNELLARYLRTIM
jgi:hypothetical protein